MLINIRVAELSISNFNSIPLAIFIGILTKSSLSEILFINDYNYNNIYYVTSNNWDNNLIEIIDITSIGNILYTNYWIWLIITSIILLLAMIGSILITVNKGSAWNNSSKNLTVYNKLIKLPSNVRSYSTIANNKTLHPNWITGFSDGEASFSVSVSKAKNNKTGWQIVPTFAIELQGRDIDLLYRILWSWKCIFNRK